MEVPQCFRIITELRSGNLYKDLSNHWFSGPEKDFICNEASRKSQEELVIDPFLYNPVHPATLTGFILERYRIDRDTFESWQRCIRKGMHNRDGQGTGRPISLDLIAINDVKRSVDTAAEGAHPLSKEATHLLFRDAKIETRKRQKLVPDAFPIDQFNTSICAKTVEMLKKRDDVRIFDRVAQDLTQSRLLALTCFRLAYISMCFIWVLCKNLPAVYKWNCDCTTFECRSEGSGKLVCVVREKGDHSQVASVSSAGELNLIVKFFGLGNAGGNIGAVVLIIAVNDMPENVFFVREILGLSSTSTVGEKGWIYICKTKGGTATLWRHWFTMICIPTISKAARLYDLRDDQDQPYRSFLSSDGEACIINEAFTEEVLDMFRANSIDYLKLGPGSTSSWQPWDVSDLFRGSKSAMKKVVSSGAIIEDDLLRRSLMQYLAAFHLEFADVSITARFKEKIIYSTMLIVYTLKKHLLPHHMAIGFIRAGITDY